LLLSDGEHGGGSLEAALGRLAAQGVRAVVVGFGTPLGSELPGGGAEPLASESGEVVVSRREDGTLRRIAAATSGAYYREAEDRPTTARLLPRPEPASAPPRRIRVAEACIALAAALLATELALSIGRRRERAPRRRWRLPWPARWKTRGLGASAAISALWLLAIGPLGLQARGDAELEAGNPREALSQYHKLERSTGATAATRLRVGNAHFRLGQLEQAESAYLSVLSELAAQDPQARFVAAFNLGTALLAEQRFAEARDALWQALLEDPESLEAKFNYEWALERVPPEEEPTVPPPPEPEKEPSEREQAEREQPQPRDQRAEERPRWLDESEAERWLESIEESPAEPMRRQAEQLGERSPSSQSSRQSW
jgi:Ca-activated chloride channel family protein